MVRLIKLEVWQTGVGCEYVRGSRLVLEGEERESVLNVITEGIKKRPVL